MLSVIDVSAGSPACRQAGSANGKNSGLGAPRTISILPFPGALDVNATRRAIQKIRHYSRYN